MDTEPDPDDVPEGLVKVIKAEGNWQTLREQWDSMYPHNLIESDEETEEEPNE